LVDDTTKIAIVGCGAICESFYLPALNRHHDVSKQLTLVDTDEERLKRIGAAFRAGYQTQDYHSILGGVRGVIIATPHSSHHRIAIDFLRNGTHVLCEKPLAVTASQAGEMMACANEAGVTLSVNNLYRLYPSLRTAKKVIADGSIGKILSIAFFDGEDFAWPTVSGFYFDKQSRGVLLDQGAHALDIICWWLGGKPDLTSCQTDSFGGPEAAVDVKFRNESCRGEVRLSRLAKLQNRYSIAGECGSISGGTKDWGSLVVQLGSAKPKLMRVAPPKNTINTTREMIIDNFLEVVRGKTDPLIPAKEVIPSLQLIDECYAAAERFDMPWCDNIEPI
jgi:predicted dehydrogenase